MRIEVQIDLPNNARIGSPFKGGADFSPLVWLLRTMSRINEWHYENGNYVPLYASGVHYVMEDGREIWPDIPNLYRNGSGDCEDLASARVGELRAGTGLVRRPGSLSGDVNDGTWIRQPYKIAARPAICWSHRADGSTLIHVGALWPNGVFEDPSRLLGMGDPSLAYRLPDNTTIIQ